MANILLVDDEPSIREIFQQILEDDGHQVITAGNGQEGIDLFRQNPIDLIITDMIMPVKDGLKFIIELENESKSVPVIAISGGGAIEAERYLKMANNIGIMKAIKKPISRDDFLGAVNEVLNNNNIWTP